MADAQPSSTIEAARDQWFDADFEGARDGFLAVLEHPDLTAAQALDAHRYLAVLFLVLGDSAASRDHADASVALSLAASPPEGSPSAAADLFRMARRRLGDRIATITIETVGTLELGEPSALVARIDPAPPALGVALRLRCGSVVETADGAVVEVRVRPNAIVACTAEWLSRGGAVLLSASREFVPLGGNLQAGAVDSRRRRAWPWVVASVAVAAAAGTTTLLLLRRDERDARFGTTSVVGW